MKKFNINYGVEFKLTEYGAEVINKHYEKYKVSPELFDIPTYKAGDIYRGQMWIAMQIFGPAIKVTADSIAEDCEIYFNDEDLVDTKPLETNWRR